MGPTSPKKLAFAAFLLGFAVPMQAAEVHWSAASGYQSLQARKVVACVVKSLGGKPTKRAGRRGDTRLIEAFNRRHATDLFGGASVSNGISIPQGTRDYYAISYFEFPGDAADAVAQRAAALNGTFAEGEPVVFQLVHEGRALAYVETPQMRKALPDDMPAIVAKVRACMRRAWR